MNSNELINFLLTALTSTVLICITIMIIAVTLIGLKRMIGSNQKDISVDKYNGLQDKNSL